MSGLDTQKKDLSSAPFADLASLRPPQWQGTNAVTIKASHTSVNSVIILLRIEKDYAIIKFSIRVITSPFPSSVISAGIPPEEKTIYKRIQKECIRI